MRFRVRLLVASQERDLSDWAAVERFRAQIGLYLGEAKGQLSPGDQGSIPARLFHTDLNGLTRAHLILCCFQVVEDANHPIP